MEEWNEELQYEFEQWIEGRDTINKILSSLAVIGIIFGFPIAILWTPFGILLFIIGVHICGKMPGVEENEMP